MRGNQKMPELLRSHPNGGKSHARFCPRHRVTRLVEPLTYVPRSSNLNSSCICKGTASSSSLQVFVCPTASGNRPILLCPWPILSSLPPTEPLSRSRPALIWKASTYPWRTSRVQILLRVAIPRFAQWRRWAGPQQELPLSGKSWFET